MIVGHKGRISGWTFEAAYCLNNIHISNDVIGVFVETMGYETKDSLAGSPASPRDVMSDPWPGDPWPAERPSPPF